MATQIRGAQIRIAYAGAGLGVSGNVMSINVDNSSIEIPVDTLRVKALGITNAMISGAISDSNLAEDYIITTEVDNSTIEFGGGTLNIVATGVTETELNVSVAGSGLTGGGGAALAVGAGIAINVDADDIDVKYDDVTIGVTGNEIYVKATGITETELHTSVAGDGLAGGGGTVLSVNVDGTSILIVGDTLQATASGLDHGELIGLGDDDHTQYSRADGTRAFTGVVGGITPTLDAHLTTKLYVDDLAAASGTVDHGNLTGLGDNDHTQYAMGVDAAPLTYSSQSIGLSLESTDLGVDGESELYVKDSGIDHDATTNFVSNEHIDHSTVSVSGAGDLLSGQGGTLVIDRIFTLSSSDVDHDATNNFIVDEHVAHSSVEITGGGILSGGGNIASSQTITLASSDVDHDATSNFLDDEHIDWTTDASPNDIHPNNITVSGVTQFNNDLDHGLLSGISDDDHSMYSRVDGLRPFTSTVGGVTPTATTDLTTKAYVDGLIQGLDWQYSVLSLSTEYGDASASGTNRYIAPSTSGTWTDNNLYFWTGSTWSGVAPNEGYATWVEDEDVLYVYNGTEWVKFGSTITHNNTTGKQGGTNNEYYHLTLSDYDDWVVYRRETIEDIVGESLAVSGTQTNIAVTYTDNGAAAGVLNFVVNTATDGGTLGVATFAAADFDVSGGTVNLDDTVPQSFDGDSGTATPTLNNIDILGGTGMTTVASGNDITISGDDATTALKGIASFDSNHFSVSAGAVSLVAAGIDDTLIDWGNGANQVDLDDVPDGATYGRVAGTQLSAGIYINATDAGTKGIATFTAADFDVVAGVVSLDDSVLNQIDGDTGSSTPTSGTISIVGGEGIDTSAAGSTVTITGEYADDAGNKGIAAFTAADFNVSAGVVSLDDTVPQSFDADPAQGTATPSSNNIDILGGEGIDTSAAGNVITITGELASSSNLGIASFTTDDFTVISGAVVIKPAGVSNTQLFNDSVNYSAGDGLGGGGAAILGGATIDLNVNVDDSTIEINADALRLKDDGTTEAKLDMANAPVDQYFMQYTTASGMQWTDMEVTDTVTESDIIMQNESGACDGSTTAFLLDETPVILSIQVFLNGLLQEKGGTEDYTYTAAPDKVTFLFAPESGDILIIHYISVN